MNAVAPSFNGVYLERASAKFGGVSCFSQIFADVRQIFEAVFLQGDLVSLAIAIGSVIIASMVMRRAGQIGAMTLLALFLFFGGCFVRGLLSAPATGGGSIGGRATGQFEAGWGAVHEYASGRFIGVFPCVRGIRLGALHFKIGCFPRLKCGRPIDGLYPARIARCRRGYSVLGLNGA